MFDDDVGVEFFQSVNLLKMTLIATISRARDRLANSEYVTDVVQRHPQHVRQLGCSQSALKTLTFNQFNSSTLNHYTHSSRVCHEIELLTILTRHNGLQSVNAVTFGQFLCWKIFGFRFKEEKLLVANRKLE